MPSRRPNAARGHPARPQGRRLRIAWHGHGAVAGVDVPALTRRRRAGRRHGHRERAVLLFGTCARAPWC